jgi:hypothetical protein
MLKRELGEDKWSISVQETEAFVSLHYGREAYVARKLPDLVVQVLGPRFYHTEYHLIRYGK